MKTVIDTLFLRRPPINYLSPGICEAIFSSTGFPIIVLPEFHHRRGPTGVRITGVFGHRRLSWNAYPGAICYNIYRADCVPDVPVENLSYILTQECVPTTSFDVNDNGCYRVTAITAEGESDLSDAVCACDSPPPTCPPGFHFDPVLKRCVCDSQDCPLGMHWDFDLCACTGCEIVSDHPLQFRNGIIDSGTPSLFRGPGFFAKQYTLEGKTGQVVSFWARSSAVDTVIYIAHSNGATLAGSPFHGNGYAKAGDIGFAACTFTLPSDDTYTFEITTQTAGETGAFYASWSTAYKETYTTVSTPRDMVYVAETNRIWVLEDDRIEVLNPDTLALESTLTPAFGSPVVMSTNGTTVYVGYTGGRIERFTNLGVSLGSFLVSVGNIVTWGLDVDSTSLFVTTNFAGPALLDGLEQWSLDGSSKIGTMAHGDTGDITRVCIATPHGAAYLSAVDKGSIIRVARADMSFSYIASPAAGAIEYQSENDTIYFNLVDGSNFWGAFDPATNAEIFRSTTSMVFAGQTHCPCNDLIYIGTNLGSVLIDTPTKSDAVHFLLIANLGNPVSGVNAVFMNDITKVYRFPAV